MTQSHISISWDDLHTPEVDEKIDRIEAVRRTHEHYVSQRAEAQKAGKAIAMSAGSGILYQPAVYMLIAGLLGGVLAWGLSEAFNVAFPNRYDEIKEINQKKESIEARVARGELISIEAKVLFDKLCEEYKHSPYISIITNTQLSQEEINNQLGQRFETDSQINRAHRMIWHAIVGVVLALFLCTAEHFVTRNWRSLIINAATAMLIALVGAILVSLIINKVYNTLGGGMIGVSLKRQIVARAVGWALFGMFIMIAPGIVMRSPKKLIIGLIGGFAGGLLGGMLFDPIHIALDSAVFSRAIAFIAIGAIAGVGTGLIETAVKAGWLKVTGGVIAGKQFIIYRNPTYLGSSPVCEIYLFRDPKVNEHHAAIHVVRGGYEIEDLNDSAQTYVNDEPVARCRLRNGDEIRIGASTFQFQERSQTVAIG